MHYGNIHSPTFSRAGIAAPEASALKAGEEILQEGGNALEAMLAMAAAIAVTYPHMNSLGGDGFWLIRAPDGRITSLDASGFAGEKATFALYRDHECESIPARGALAALTVPGAIGGWIKAQEFARDLGGKLPLRILLEEAARLAKEGTILRRSEASGYTIREEAALRAAPHFQEHFWPEGKRPEEGSLRKQPALAATLAQLAHAGLDDFYRGDLAQSIAADLARIGAPITRADLKRYEAKERKPLRLAQEKRTLYNFTAPSQGLTSLMILGIFARLNIKKGESVAHIHALIEASKRAMAVRDRFLTDFDQLDHPPQTFLEDKALAFEATQIDMHRAASWPLAAPLQTDAGDTVWMGAIDKNGMAVSYIQSIFWEYGSGCVLPETGILMQNRGTSFSLQPHSHRALAPGRRPYHTLNPALCTFEDGRIMPYGSMGGDGQPQFQAALFTRYADFGMSLSKAIDAPRFLWSKTIEDKAPLLRLENRFDSALIKALEKMGHEIAPPTSAYHDSFGHAGALVKHPRGEVEATHDPRSDGGAAGI